MPLSVGGAGSTSNTMSPGLKPTSIPSGILIHPAVWPQYTWAEKWGPVVRLSMGGGANNVAWVEAYLCTKWYLHPSNYLATIHQRYRQTGQWSRSIGRTVTCNSRPIKLMSRTIKRYVLSVCFTASN